ncbi:uncharacterized protein LOC127010947 [Drosophila biarmipes]|uniref:uncharacterized protein LOC127010947 n=1 Tax=Drosophila biarmipes TaxID=125945 RepID=UPI0021CCED43|nr:uncharacterized protein LOC127010947 [Drosophila biarmipes]
MLYFPNWMLYVWEALRLCPTIRRAECNRLCSLPWTRDEMPLVSSGTTPLPTTFHKRISSEKSSPKNKGIKQESSNGPKHRVTENQPETASCRQVLTFKGRTTRGE